MRKSKEPYLHYYRLLGFFPNDPTIFDQALVHKSSSRLDKQGKWENNERLEFLGDAILDAIVADILYRRFHTKKEGFLTNTRSKIVQRESLNRIAIELGLDKMIVVAPASKANFQNSCIFGNALEALIGAIYLDQGYERCRTFIVDRIITPHIDIPSLAHKEVNFKSALIEWSQKHKIDITFDLIEEFHDAEGNLMFQTRILVSGMAIGIGVGHSKKESQQQAAEMALLRLKKEKPLMDEILAKRNGNDITDQAYDEAESANTNPSTGENEEQPSA